MLNINNLVELDKESGTITFPLLSKEVPNNKLIPSNFSSIKHLSGSRLIDDKDSYMSKEGQRKFIEKKLNLLDNIIVTEKIDGMNAGLMRLNNEYYSLSRKGYDVRTKILYEDNSINFLFFFWAYYCSEFVQKYVLMEGERLVFENAMMIHSLQYDFKKQEPVFLLAVYDKDNKRTNYEDTKDIAYSYDVQLPPVLSERLPLKPEGIMKFYDKSPVGCKGLTEGLVYWYERYNSDTHSYSYDGLAKYVSNTRAGTSKEFPNRFNQWSEMKKYLEIKMKVCDYWYK